MYVKSTLFKNTEHDIYIEATIYTTLDVFYKMVKLAEKMGSEAVVDAYIQEIQSSVKADQYKYYWLDEDYAPEEIRETLKEDIADMLKAVKTGNKEYVDAHLFEVFDQLLKDKIRQSPKHEEREGI